MKVHFKTFILLSIFLFAFTSAAGNKWAVLIAGSNTWFNYRHQADVFHAYQVLLKNNFDQDKIIVFAYDDIANNSRNPFPGKVFNKPSYQNEGEDVYKGVKIDYSGNNVNPTVFLNVLQGNKNSVKGVGTERVLQSTDQDNVFMFFSDHGAPGLIAFPSVYLYADQLLSTFAKMKGKYNKFVFYLETCQSGSMFTNLPTNVKIYALSAANPTQSSWGTYCSPDDAIQGKHIGTCLGDLFSVSFIEDIEQNDMSKQTLSQQFQKVRVLTSRSHVMQWGDLSYIENKVSDFVSGSTPGSLRQFERKFNLRQFKRVNDVTVIQSSTIDSRTMKVKLLSQIYSRQRTEQSYKQLRQQMQSMQRYDNIFSQLASKMKLRGHYSSKRINFDCLRQTMQSFEGRCGKLSDYGLRYVKYFAQGCEMFQAEKIIKNIHC